jgi:hypothetical protein
MVLSLTNKQATTYLFTQPTNNLGSTMKIINPLFIPLKSVQYIKHTHTVSAHSGNLHKMNAYQVWKSVGMRHKVYAKSDLETVYSACDEFWETIESRLVTSILLVDPTYVPRRSTMAAKGDKYTAIRHDLYMALRGLFKAYATRNWQWVSTYSVKVNEHYLRHYRELFGEVQYRNHENIACGDTFIAPKDRTLFGRRKK